MSAVLASAVAMAALKWGGVIVFTAGAFPMISAAAAAQQRMSLSSGLV